MNTHNPWNEVARLTWLLEDANKQIDFLLAQLKARQDVDAKLRELARELEDML